MEKPHHGHRKCHTQLAQNVENTCRYLATKRITEITTSNKLNVTQKMAIISDKTTEKEVTLL